MVQSVRCLFLLIFLVPSLVCSFRSNGKTIALFGYGSSFTCLTQQQQKGSTLCFISREKIRRVFRDVYTLSSEDIDEKFTVIENAHSKSKANVLFSLTHIFPSPTLVATIFLTLVSYLLPQTLSASASELPMPISENPSSMLISNAQEALELLDGYKPIVPENTVLFVLFVGGYMMYYKIYRWLSMW